MHEISGNRRNLKENSAFETLCKLHESKRVDLEMRNYVLAESYAVWNHGRDKSGGC